MPLPAPVTTAIFPLMGVPPRKLDPSRRLAQSRKMLRRSVLTGLAAVAVPAAAQSEPFPLGIASGCPRPDSVVLWTRVRPSDRTVTWAIAEDERMQRIVRSG